MAGKSKNKQNRRTTTTNSNGVRRSYAPASVSVAMSSMEPRITRGNRCMTVSHRELVVTSIAGSTTFTVQKFLQINPGLATTFPWLAPQAQQWEQYACRKLVAWYVPIAPSSTAGDILLSPNYDASDPKPTTETQAGNNWGTITDSCWQPFSLVLDAKAMMALGPRRFVRPCAVAGDVKTFDVATISVCSNNETGTSAVGKLYLEYIFDFFIPQSDPSPATIPLYTSLWTQNNDQTLTTTVAANVAFDTLIFDPLGVGAGAAGIFTPPAGSYLIRTQISCTDSSAEAFTGLLESLKNGASQSVIRRCEFITTAPAGGDSFLVLFDVINFNGTDTFSLSLTLAGAAGTLKVKGGYAQLVMSLA